MSPNYEGDVIGRLQERERRSDLVILRIINFIKFSFHSGNEHKILAVGILLMSSSLNLVIYGGDGLKD